MFCVSASIAIIMNHTIIDTIIIISCIIIIIIISIVKFVIVHLLPRLDPRHLACWDRGLATASDQDKQP